jgi:hypothetical protein
LYYPINRNLARHFSTEEEARRFGAEMFCEFLADTIEVELSVVIPSVVCLRRIPYQVPDKPKQDLFKTATDEGFHAEQSLQFLSELRGQLSLPPDSAAEGPLFLRRLELQRAAEPNPVYRQLITVLNGVVTETRISVELSKFAGDESLADPVRRVCHSHAQDEAVHSSQFRALGKWLWSEFDTDTRFDVSRFLVASTIARSMPDIERFILLFHRATGRGIRDCERLVCSSCTSELLLGEMLRDGAPTLTFLRALGVDSFLSFESELDEELERLCGELERRVAGGL